MASSEKVLIIDLNENPENQRLLAGEPQTCGMRSMRRVSTRKTPSSLFLQDLR